MSAFMCDDAVFDALAEYAQRIGVVLTIPPDAPYRLRAGEMFGIEPRACGSSPELACVDLCGHGALVGAILRDENARSVESRYPEVGATTALGTRSPYAFRPVTTPLTDRQVIAALAWFNYQTCETDDFPLTLAHAVVGAIEAAAKVRVAEGSGWSVPGADGRPSPP